jgi:hypothetical protein
MAWNRNADMHSTLAMYSQRYGLVLTGAPALTSRQLKEADFVTVVELLDRGVAIAAQAKKKSGRDSFKWKCVDLQDLWYLNLGDTSAEQY